MGNWYLKLCKSGCTLFRDWRATFVCSPQESEENTRVQFGLTEHMLVGDVDDGDVGFHINNLCRFTENCFNDWQEYLHEQRSRFTELNYYTIEQLVFLSTELAKLRTPNDTLSPHVLSILQSVKNDCTVRDIKLAMKKTQDDLTNMEMKRSDDVISAGDPDSIADDEMNEDSELRELIEDLVREYDFSEEIIRKAWANVGSNKDESRCCLY